MNVAVEQKGISTYPPLFRCTHMYAYVIHRWIFLALRQCWTSTIYPTIPLMLSQREALAGVARRRRRKERVVGRKRRRSKMVAWLLLSIHFSASVVKITQKSCSISYQLNLSLPLPATKLVYYVNICSSLIICKWFYFDSVGLAAMWQVFYNTKYSQEVLCMLYWLPEVLAVNNWCCLSLRSHWLIATTVKTKIRYITKYSHHDTISTVNLGSKLCKRKYLPCSCSPQKLVSWMIKIVHWMCLCISLHTCTGWKLTQVSDWWHVFGGESNHSLHEGCWCRGVIGKGCETSDIISILHIHQSINGDLQTVWGWEFVVPSS